MQEHGIGRLIDRKPQCRDEEEPSCGHVPDLFALAESETKMTPERHEKRDQPADHVARERREAEILHTAHGDQPVSGRSGATDDHEETELMDQRKHDGRTREGGGKNTERQCIVVCADDFGMNREVDGAILALAAQGRLSAASVLTLGPSAAERPGELAALPIDIGVHLNFTESFGCEGLYLPLGQLIKQAYTRRLPAAVVRAQIVAQLDAFETLFGRAPDYIDGHQHVHQLPIIRRELIAEMARRYGAAMPWLRCTAAGPQSGLGVGAWFKARVIAGLGSNALGRAARRVHSARNRRLLGVYDFTGGEAGYRHAVRHWLQDARQGDLMMCHPALPDSPDAMAAQRAAEFAVLGSTEMAAWLAESGVAIARLTGAARYTPD